MAIAGTKYGRNSLESCHRLGSTVASDHPDEAVQRVGGHSSGKARRSLRWRSNWGRRGSVWQSPMRIVHHFDTKRSETLEFPEFWHNCHADSGDLSGKSGLKELCLKTPFE